MKQHQPINADDDGFPDSAADDVRRAVLAGRRDVVEEMLAKLPAAAADVEQALDLVYAEIAAREEAGESPVLFEYTTRFPDWAERIKRLFEVHEAFRETEVMGETDVSPTDSTFPGIEVAESVSAAQLPLNDSRTVGQYELLEEIGSGATGIVFRAQQAGLSRMVAVKILRPFGTDDARERFRAEAELTAQLQHPSIVQVHEVGTDAGCDFMSMELLDGGSLAATLGQTAYTPLAAADLVHILAAAVSAAHEQGIVHRDLKPGNILMANDGSPRISDFGLARHLSEAAVRHTRTGAILGTPGYMAPEQAHGSLHAGSSADIYSLGAILYELLTGRPPYHGTSVVEILEQMQVTDPPQVRQLRPGVPRDLQTICMKCLERDTADRYASAADLRDDLDRYREGKPIQARPVSLVEYTVRWASRHKSVAALSTLLLLTTIAGTAGVIWQWQRAEDGLSQAQSAAIMATSAQGEEQLQRLTSERRLYRQQIMTADRELQFGMSTMGEKLLSDCDRDRRGWEWDYLNANAQSSNTLLGELNPSPSALAVSPDGRLVAVTLGQYSTPTSRRTLVKDLETGSLLWQYSEYNMGISLAFSPDSQYLITAAHGKATLHDARSGEVLRRFLVKGGRSNWGTSFSPDGSFVAVADGHTVRLFDVKNEDAPAIVCSGLERSQGAYAVSFHPTEPIVAVATRSMGVTLHDYATGDLITQLSTPGDTRGVRFRPDGRMLAAAGYSQHDQGCLRIWDYVDGVFELRHERFDRAGSRTNFEFSADGQAIAVWGGASAVRLLNCNDLRTLASYPAHSYTRDLVFLPDSRRFITCGSDGRVRLWDRAREFRRFLVRSDVALATDFAFHPNGDRVAMVGDVNPSRGNSSYDCSIEIFDLNQWKRAQRLIGHTAAVTCVDFDSPGRLLASGSDDATVRLWIDAATQQPSDQAAHIIDSHDEAIAGVHFLPSHASQRQTSVADTTLLSVSVAGEIHVHDISSGNMEGGTIATEIRAPKLSTSMANVIHTDLRGALLALATSDGQAAIVHTPTGEVTQLCQDDCEIRSIAFDEAADQIAIACDDGTVKFWSISETSPLVARHLWTSAVHDGPVVSVAFHPTGNRIVSASEDGLVHILDTVGGARMMSLKSHSYPAPVSRAMFDHTGQRLVATVRNRLYVWDATMVVPIPLNDLAKDAEAHALVTDWHRGQAMEGHRDENWFGAAFHWNRVAELDPSDVMCHVWQAEVWEQQQNWAAAEASYQMALSVADRHGTFLSRDRGRACYGYAKLLATCPDQSHRQGVTAAWYAISSLATHPRMLSYWKSLWCAVVECNRAKQ